MGRLLEADLLSRRSRSGLWHGQPWVGHVHGYRKVPGLVAPALPSLRCQDLVGWSKPHLTSKFALMAPMMSSSLKSVIVKMTAVMLR